MFIEEDISSLPDSDANFQKNKSASSMVAPFNTLLVDVAPTPLQTEKGLESLNRRVQNLFRNAGIHDFSTHNEEKKARIVERFNRTLKTRICLYLMKHQAWRYSEVLQDFVRTYNCTLHRSIGMAPSQVSAKNQEQVWQRLYGHDGKGVPKFRAMDGVRISKVKRQFKKATW